MVKNGTNNKKLSDAKAGGRGSQGKTHDAQHEAATTLQDPQCCSGKINRRSSPVPVHKKDVTCEPLSKYGMAAGTSTPPPHSKGKEKCTIQIVKKCCPIDESLAQTQTENQPESKHEKSQTEKEECKKPPKKSSKNAQTQAVLAEFVSTSAGSGAIPVTNGSCLPEASGSAPHTTKCSSLPAATDQPSIRGSAPPATRGSYPSPATCSPLSATAGTAKGSAPPESTAMAALVASKGSPPPESTATSTTKGATAIASTGAAENCSPQIKCTAENKCKHFKEQEHPLMLRYRAVLVDAKPTLVKLSEARLDPSKSSGKNTKCQAVQAVPPPPVKSTCTATTEIIAGSIDDEFDRMKDENVAILWIIGYTQASVAANKRRCLNIIMQSNSLGLINVEKELKDWYDSKKRFIQEPEDVQGKIIYHGKRLAQKVIDQKMPLTLHELCQAFKLAVVANHLKNPELHGFFLDNFPVNVQEGEESEEILIQSMVCLYFESKNWTDNKSVPPKIITPKYKLRSGGYSENAAEAAADHFGYKTIKILNSEELEEIQIHDIDTLVKKHLEGHGLELHKIAKHVHKHHDSAPGGASTTITEFASKVVVDHRDFLPKNSKDNKDLGKQSLGQTQKSGSKANPEEGVARNSKVSGNVESAARNSKVSGPLNGAGRNSKPTASAEATGKSSKAADPSEGRNSKADGEKKSKMSNGVSANNEGGRSTDNVVTILPKQSGGKAVDAVNSVGASSSGYYSGTATALKMSEKEACVSETDKSAGQSQAGCNEDAKN